MSGLLINREELVIIIKVINNTQQEIPNITASVYPHVQHPTDIVPGNASLLTNISYGKLKVLATI